ncbi:MAG: OmpA family protein [Chitinophagaceae bacterium]|nr:OmpA family protein [Chitinophagaceae bacterium]
MKKVFLLATLLVVVFTAHSQILKKIKDKAKEKVDKTIDDASKGNKEEKKETDDNNTEPASTTGAGQPASIKAYSKYDFVPGEKIVVFEDFMQDAVGDFPDKWNTNVSGETVTIEGKQGHWLMINKSGIFIPEFIDSLPDNFTFEFDLLCDNPGKVWSLYTSIVELSDRNHPESWQSASNRFTFTVAPYPDGNSTSVVERRRAGVGEAGGSTSTKQFSDKTKPVHIAVWRQKERVRVYFNEEKAWDLPKAMLLDGKYNTIVYWLQGATPDGNYYLTNLRLAVGNPDTRKKILEQNKWVTHGILFDVNSDKIKPESYGTLKEMANVLKEFPDLKVKIVGHTDADGSDAANLDLSKRRAAAVKESLAKEFGIDESRMETDGKGESEPIDKNDTPAGKANNRRVEFIKI